MAPDGTYVYLAMHLQAGLCVATGASADLGPGAYTGPRRDHHPEPAGYYSLPEKERARGHLIAHALGGDDTLPQNFVALTRVANSKMKSVGEIPLINAIKDNGNEFVDVEPEYGDQSSPIPTSIALLAIGKVSECYVFGNDNSGIYSYC